MNWYHLGGGNKMARVQYVVLALSLVCVAAGMSLFFAPPQPVAAFGALLGPAGLAGLLFVYGVQPIRRRQRGTEPRLAQRSRASTAHARL